MKLKEAVQILNQVANEEWVIINKKYNADDLSQALETCYHSNLNKIIKQTIDKIIDVHTLHGGILLMKAMMLIDDSRDQDAIHLLTLVPSDDKEFLFCIELIGLIFVNNYKFKKGIQTFNVLLTQEIPPERKAFLHHQRAICFQYEQDFVSAFHDCITAAELNDEENDFYKEALLNLQLCIQNDRIMEIKDQITFFESFCDKFNAKKLMNGPLLCATEIALLKNNHTKVKGLKKIIIENELEENELLKRINKIIKFLKYTENFNQINNTINSINKPSLNHSLNNKLNKQQFKKAEDEVFKYINKVEPYKIQLEEIKTKMRKINEDDFLHFEKMVEVNFLSI